MTSFRLCSMCAAAVMLTAVAATPAAAQDGRITVGVNFGGQFGSSDFTQTTTPIIYEEAGSISVAQTAGSGGLFDLGGSVLLFGNIGVGVSYSHTSGDGDASIAAAIPDPLVFDRPRNASAAASDLQHTEDAVHVQVQYRFAVSPKLDVTVGVGPSFFSVKQELVTNVAVSEPGPSITPTVTEVSSSPVGVNLGADAAYLITKSIGVGVLLRYAKSTADFDLEGSSVSVDAGGFQFAAGVRVRF